MINPNKVFFVYYILSFLKLIISGIIFYNLEYSIINIIYIIEIPLGI